MRPFSTGYPSGLTRFPPLQTHLYDLLPSAEAQTANIPRRESIWVGSSAPPSCPMRHHSSTDDMSCDFRRRGQCRDTINSFSAPNLRRVFFGPRDCRRLASEVRESRRVHWRYSWILLQAALRSLHRPPLAPRFSPSYTFVGALLPRAAIAPPPTLETMDSLTTPASSPPLAQTN